MSGQGAGDDLQTLRHVCGEAKTSIDNQIEKIHQEEKKASSITRLNLLLIGVLVSGVSLGIHTEGLLIDQLLNTHLVLGVVFLVLSTVGASMAYISTEFTTGISDEGVHDVLADRPDESEYLRDLARYYETWLDKNHKAHRLNTYLITWSMIFSIWGLFLSLGGVIVGVLEAQATLFSQALLAAEVLALLILGLCLYYSRYLSKKFRNIRY